MLCGLGGKILVVIVVDLYHGRVDTRTEALDLDEGEETVRGCFALLDAKFLFYRLDDSVTAAATELAGCLSDVVSISALNPQGIGFRFCRAFQTSPRHSYPEFESQLTVVQA